MEEEIWKSTIEGYEGLIVSNFGNFKNAKTGTYLNVHKNPRGYSYFSFHGTKMSHRVVARAFPEICGEWFEGCHVHHKNHNPADCRAENLIVLTKEEHYKAHKHKKHKTSIVGQYSLDGILFNIHLSAKDAEKWGYDSSCIYKCIHGEIKQYKGWVWKIIP